MFQNLMMCSKELWICDDVVSDTLSLYPLLYVGLNAEELSEHLTTESRDGYLLFNPNRSPSMPTMTCLYFPTMMHDRD